MGTVAVYGLTPFWQILAPLRARYHGLGHVASGHKGVGPTSLPPAEHYQREVRFRAPRASNSPPLRNMLLILWEPPEIRGPNIDPNIL